MFLQCIVDRNRKYGAGVILTCGFIYVSGFCFSFQNDSTVLGNCSVWRIYISPQTVGNIVKIKQGSAGGWLRKIIEQHPKLCTPQVLWKVCLCSGTRNVFCVLYKYSLFWPKKYILEQKYSTLLHLCFLTF